jgi:hypothetical protein
MLHLCGSDGTCESAEQTTVAGGCRGVPLLRTTTRDRRSRASRLIGTRAPAPGAILREEAYDSGGRRPFPCRRDARPDRWRDRAFTQPEPPSSRRFRSARRRSRTREPKAKESLISPVLSAAIEWGSTAAERSASYPCEDFVPGADLELFRAIDISAPVAVVFRWLCQLRAAPTPTTCLTTWGGAAPGS